MISKPYIAVIIPAYNEEEAIGKVLAEIPKDWASEVVVCDNNSKDRTAEIARDAGATVVFQEEKGYGNACLKGLEYLKSKEEKPDIVVFMDGDYSDFPEQIPEVVRPIIEDKADLVLGSRTLGMPEAGSLTPQKIFGNNLATSLIELFFKFKFTDLGPFRAIKYAQLMALEMEDRTFGWTVEMQVKSVRLGYRCLEVPVSYRKRLGESKISGTISGAILSSQRVLWAIFKLI